MDMRNLKKKYSHSFKNSLILFIRKNWSIFGIFLVSLIFFYPVVFLNKVPLPVDALVGAHVPWTELKWDKFPAGIPIKNQEITDAFSQFYPWRSLVGEFWRNGKAPLWNSYMFSGTPFLATLHSASLYPLNIVYLFFSDIHSWSLLIFMQIMLSGIFTYVFLKEIGLKTIACFLGAIAFSFSGYMIAWLEFATGGHAGLWLPLLLLFELKLIKTQRVKWLLPVCLAFFFIFTAGDFQAPLYIVFTYLLFGMFITGFKKTPPFQGGDELNPDMSSSLEETPRYQRGEDVITFQKNNFSSSSKKFLFVITGLSFGIILSLPQLLPTVELFTKSVRVTDPYIKEYFYGLMHWEKIVNFLWPDFFGNVVTRNYWGKYGFHEYLSFVGIIPLTFAVFSFFKKKDKIEIFFWMLLSLSLIFLFPTPLAFLPYKLSLPGLGTSSASRIIFLVDFCLAILAAYGFNKWQMKHDKNLLKTIFYFIVITFSVAIGLTLSVYQMRGSVMPEIYNNLKVALKNMVPSTIALLSLGLLVLSRQKLKKRKFSKHVFKIFPLLILTLTLLELLRFAWKNTPFSNKEFLFPKTRIIEFLEEQDKPFRIAGGIPLNLFMAFSLESAEGYDPLYPVRNSEWYSIVNSGALNSLSGRYGMIHRFDSPLIDYANIKYVIDYKKDTFGTMSEDGKYNLGIDPSKYKEINSEGRIKVFENQAVLPKIWVSANYKVAEDTDELIDFVKNDNNSLNKLIVLEKKPGVGLNDKKIEYFINNYSEDLNKINFSVDVNDDTLIFLSESYDSGWKVKIDENEEEIFRANYLFQAVPIKKGTHNVEFIYKPRAYYYGVVISTFSLLCLSVFILFSSRSREIS